MSAVPMFGVFTSNRIRLRVPVAETHPSTTAQLLLLNVFDWNTTLVLSRVALIVRSGRFCACEETVTEQPRATVINRRELPKTVFRSWVDGGSSVFGVDGFMVSGKKALWCFFPVRLLY